MSSSVSIAPLRAAVIGAGTMGRWHAAAVRRAGHRVSAIYDTNPLRGATLASAHRARLADSAREAMEHADVVHVCTPLSTHSQLAEAALERGRSVICEKPLVETTQEASGLHALATRRGAVLVPTHQFLLQPGVRRMVRRIPLLGTLLHLDFTACTTGAVGRDADGADAVARDILSHPLSLIERLMPGALTGLALSIVNSVHGELRLMGATGQTTVGILISCRGRPPVNQLRLIGERGTMTADLFHGFVVDDRTAPTRLGKLGRPFSHSLRTLGSAAANLTSRAARGESAYPGLRTLVAATYRAVQEHTPPPISASESVAVVTAWHDIVSRRWPALPMPHEVAQ